MNVTDALSERGHSTYPGVFERCERDRMTRLLAEESIVRGRAGARHLLRVPFVRTLAENSRLRDLARLFVGDSAIPFRATLFDKSTASNWRVSWH